MILTTSMISCPPHIFSQLQMFITSLMMPESYKLIENQIKDTLNYIDLQKKLIIKHVIKSYDVFYQCLLAHLHDRSFKAEHSSINWQLNETQEAALCCYIDTLDKQRISLKHVQIAYAINKILQEVHLNQNSSSESTSTLFMIDKHWLKQFLNRHLKYHIRWQRIIEMIRKQAHELNFI